MAGLADLTFFSELKYPTIIAGDTYTATSNGMVVLETGVPTDARVMVWGSIPTSTLIGYGQYIRTPALTPDGELSIYLNTGDKITYRIYAR